MDFTKGKDAEKNLGLTRTVSTSPVGQVFDNVSQLERRLGNRQLQLIAIGGSIGTGLFVTIGSGLSNAGPASLVLGVALYCVLIGLVNNCMAEMATFMPISGGFIRMSGKWVDEALGFMVGWNFFLYEGLIIPFEITALTVLLSFWSDNIPAWAIITVCIILYGILNVLAVGVYGEVEFWLSSGKVILVCIVFGFTFFTMVGVNPQHDAYGFRNWKHGAFAEYRSSGNAGRLEGFLAALWSASFFVVGPEYLSMAAGEVKRPRIYVKAAFKTAFWRFAFFFLGSALCVSVIISHRDPTLAAILGGSGEGGGTAAASPYVIAMKNMQIGVLPHIVNALLVTSIFSAGNTYTYCAIRSLYSLALEGQAPAFLKKCTKSGVPIYCFVITMAFPMLSFLQLSSSSSTVLHWLVNLVTAGCVIDYVVICITFLFFYRACRVQGIDRRTLPYYGYFQPYSAWAGLVGTVFVVLFYGYSSFAPWSVATFFTYYTMVLVAIATFSSWKLFKRTKVVPAHEADLVWERPSIDAYEATFEEEPVVSFWVEVLQMVDFRKVLKRK